MKIVVIGGSGLIGKKLGKILEQVGHNVVAASPSTGVNTLSGEGLDRALAGAKVVVDVSNSPSFADDEVLDFFRTSTRNLLAAETRAGVEHHIALSVVGADRLPDSGYMRAKVVQEQLIKDSDVPYTIVRATQFFEFLGAIAGPKEAGATVRLSTAPLQPLAADDVAEGLAMVVAEGPHHSTIELAGPEKMPLADFVERYLILSGDQRTVVGDAQAQYFGTTLDRRGLAPDGNARIGHITFSEWMERATVPA
jgi:uncharacterized protein YbjT (DUF2867 family)